MEVSASKISVVCDFGKVGYAFESFREAGNAIKVRAYSYMIDPGNFHTARDATHFGRARSWRR